jgi:hypothetical protein
MGILQKIEEKIIKECSGKNVTYWVIPVPDDDSFKWEIESFESENDLDNWMVIIHKLKHLWKKDFEKCRSMHAALPRGSIIDGNLLHGNNCPINLCDVAEKLGYDLSKDLKPSYNRKYGIKLNDMTELEKIIGYPLELEYTE